MPATLWKVQAIRSAASALLGVAAFAAPAMQMATAEEHRKSASLQMMPEQCIAHTQGQTCYQTIVATWQVAERGDYCLYEDAQTEPLACWQNRQQGKATILFESNQSIRFELRPKQADAEPAVLAQAEITVTWVYRKSKQKRTTWRLF